MDDYQNIIALSRYSRWKEEEQRRETWPEIVKRHNEYLLDYLADRKLFNEEVDDMLAKAENAVLNLEVMPSMRSLMAAGPALARCNVAGYNCAYTPIETKEDFDEIMYILMNGTGVGFSVERHYVEKLPPVPRRFKNVDKTISIEDSKEGWADGLRQLISLLYSGEVPKWDVSKIRQAGAPLKTFGGRASGPDPLISLFNMVVKTFRGAKGRNLRPIECHDIVCKIAEVIVVGGVRRSALISLSDLDDKRMSQAKSVTKIQKLVQTVVNKFTPWNISLEWWNSHPERSLANNSAVYSGRPTYRKFKKEWKELVNSGSGERGIFNREACEKQVMRNGRRDAHHTWGTNPCSEIILRPRQFCNLTEVVVRREDDFDTLKDKIDVAVFLGTVQSMWTEFKYIRDEYKENCDEERLLGVSLTGIYDNINVTRYYEQLRDYAVERNKHYAKMLGISQSVAVTCVKPSGTVSQLVNSASGLHPRFSEYYIRNIRSDKKDPMTQFLIDQNVPNEPCVLRPDDQIVFSFYVKSPEGAITDDQLSPESALSTWLTTQDKWCEHKPSVTINVPDDKWNKMRNMVWSQFDRMTGIALFPKTENVYAQAPYIKITKEDYENRPIYEIDWSKLSDYEKTDSTRASQELACTGGQCEITNL